MKTFKQFMAEMAKPPEDFKGTTFYHGTTNTEHAHQIMKDGYLKGQEKQGKGRLAPVKNKVYVTKHIGFAQIHAIGGDMAGHDTHIRDRNGNKPEHGYVFGVKGEHLHDVQPDEDQAGELATSKHDNGVHPHIKALAKRVATPNQYRQAQDGFYAHQSAIGKKMMKHLSDSDKLHLIDKGAHIAHEGNVPITHVWRIHHSKIKHLNRDGSNFFDHAEKIK